MIRHIRNDLPEDSVFSRDLRQLFQRGLSKAEIDDAAYQKLISQHDLKRDRIVTNAELRDIFSGLLEAAIENVNLNAKQPIR